MHIAILRTATFSTFSFLMIYVSKGQITSAESFDVLILYVAEDCPFVWPDMNKSCMQMASLLCESSCVSQGQHSHKSAWSKMGTSNCESQRASLGDWWRWRLAVGEGVAAQGWRVTEGTARMDA